MLVSVAFSNDFARICDETMTDGDDFTHLSMSSQWGSKVPLLATMVTALATKRSRSRVDEPQASVL